MQGTTAARCYTSVCTYTNVVLQETQAPMHRCRTDNSHYINRLHKYKLYTPTLPPLSLTVTTLRPDNDRTNSHHACDCDYAHPTTYRIQNPTQPPAPPDPTIQHDHDADPAPKMGIHPSILPSFSRCRLPHSFFLASTANRNSIKM